MLYIIGLGLTKESISLEGRKALQKCNTAYLESYTSKLLCSTEELEQALGLHHTKIPKKLISATRELVEKQAEDTILKDAEQGNTAFLVVGDALSATTHIDLLLRAKERNIPTKIINNVSILNAISNSGLELYKFGKTTSIVFPQDNFTPESCFDIITQNQDISAHTLCLLDIKAEQEKYMSVHEAIHILLGIAEKRDDQDINENTLMLGCARVGTPEEQFVYGTAQQLLKVDFGKPLHCLIIPSRLHFKEEEMLEEFKV
jgi:diphthine synthase